MLQNCSCPNCGSTNTKSLPVIFESGQRIGRARKSSVWLGKNSISVGLSETDYQSCTLLSHNATPSAKSASTSGKTVLTIISILFLGIILSMVFSIWMIPVSIVLAAMTYGGSDDYYIKKIQNKIALINWQNTFRCLRCGETFIPT